MAGVSSQGEIGTLLRKWRERRGRTQLDLALDAGISPRHLSFVETGRSRPGRETLLRIVGHLDLPLREQNALLLGAGHAPAIPERSLQGAELAPVREALDLILSGHEPYPAVVVDRHWNMVAVNSAMAALSASVDPQLLEPPINIMRVGLHPLGLAASIVNLAQARAYFLGRLERQLALSGDDELADLLEEAKAYPAPERGSEPAGDPAAANIISPLIRMRLPDGSEVSLFATVATFGTAIEVTTSELSIELAFPANAASAEALRAFAQNGPMATTASRA
jgi:transcriptional regulator with XRE-family HTH domain